VLVGGFAPNRTQRRIWRKNANVTMRLVPPYATREHYALFRRYVLSRHAGGGMADMDFADYRAMIEDSPVSTHLAEYREPDGRLFGVCLTDRMSDGQSLVYSFFEPSAEARSPGGFMVLAAIATAQTQGLDYVYLGYWIGQSRKMAYKRTYQPLEALTPNGWQRLGPPEAAAAEAAD
jgi:arginine-tRNA-protein transferase